MTDPAFQPIHDNAPPPEPRAACAGCSTGKCGSPLRPVLFIIAATLAGVLIYQGFFARPEVPVNAGREALSEDRLRAQVESMDKYAKPAEPEANTPKTGDSVAPPPTKAP